MKLIFTTLLACLFSVVCFGQLPAKMSYQAIIRDANNSLITDQGIGMQVTVLQGSASGNTVYSETHSVATNINGMVSLEIGTGVSANLFTDINWAEGPYFIKTETDATQLGGTEYSITGVTEMLSVPYALFALNSGSSIRGPRGDAGLNGMDGIAGQDGKSLLYGTTNPINKGNDGDFYINTSANTLFGPKKDGTWPSNGTSLLGPKGNDGVGIAQTISKVGSIVTLSDGGGTVSIDDGDSDATNEIQDLTITNDILSIEDGATSVDLTKYIELPTGGLEGQILKIIDGALTWAYAPSALHIGDTYAGGIVFYIDASGCHGLVAVATNQSGAEWGCYGAGEINGADGTAVGTGNQNTIDIELGCATSGTAADICANLTLGGYDDWFLPSIGELNLMYENIGQGNALGLGNVGGFANTSYWSSTEYGTHHAWRRNFANASNSFNAKDVTYYVRAVRAF